MEKENKRYTHAQKEAYERYVEKNDLVKLGIWVKRKQRKKYQQDAYNAGKSLNQYVIDKLEGRE